LTQHSFWSRRNHPFILCKCKWGQAVANYGTHRYRIIKDIDQVKYYDRSKMKFEELYGNDYTKFNTNKHREWADESNYGITHFGIHPNDLLNSHIGFDALHCRLSVGRGILSFIRKYLEGSGYILKEKFCEILCKRIGEYYVEYYETGKILACFHRQQVNKFISLMLIIAQFFEKYFESSEVVNAIKNIMTTYLKIDSFIRITYIQNPVLYEEEI